MLKTITIDDLIQEASSNASLERISTAHWTLGRVDNVSFEQAVKRSARGDDSLVPEAERMIDSLALDGFETRGREWQLTVAGAYPLVPEFLANRPDCMRGLVVDTNETMPVRLIVDLFASCSFSSEQLRARGLVMLALTMMLERYRPVELMVMCSSLMRDTERETAEPAALLIPVHTKPVNLSVAAFLFSPAFVRLLLFAYMEGIMRVPSCIPADTHHVCRRVLELGPSDIYIEPAIGDSRQTSQILGNPRQWLQAQLDRILQPEPSL